MATREQRIAEFTADDHPRTDMAVELLCEDHRGTYVLPFNCAWTDGEWQNARTRERIEVTVLGWRKPTRGDGL
jgi:hypothetical protein